MPNNSNIIQKKEIKLVFILFAGLFVVGYCYCLTLHTGKAKVGYSSE